MIQFYFPLSLGTMALSISIGDREELSLMRDARQGDEKTVISDSFN